MEQAVGNPSNDMTSCNTLEIVIDDTGTKVWINVEGENVGRWSNIRKLHIEDRRATATAPLPSRPE
jgi:hypothetical protein